MQLKTFIEKYRVHNNIKRYAMETTLRKQNLSEHGYGVGSLFFLLCGELDLEPTAEDVFMAMNHDFAETYTGDLNRLIKHKNSETKESWQIIEDQILPENVGKYSDFKLEEHFEEKMLSVLHLSDDIEAFLYCNEEYNGGNMHLARARTFYLNRITEALREPFLSELNWILENLIGRIT